MARRVLLHRAAALALVACCAAAPAPAATIQIVNLDGPGEGFNDPTPAAPVGGNPGTTIGAQRLYVFQHAADIWGGLLPSTVPILVNARFDPQTCDATSGVLGGARPLTTHRDFPNAPHPGTWYHQALANKLAGFDLSATNDIEITFNADIGKPACLPSGWYYGVDGQEGPAIELLPVVLHELGHGLGFSTTTLAGVQSNGFPHVYDRFLFDRTQGMHWHEMTEPQRAASAQNCQALAWDGPNVMANAPFRLGPKPVLRANAPATVAGDYEVGLASFGPSLTEDGVTGPVVLVNDGLGVPTNGCEPLINAAEVNGKIALIDRGGCPFTQKAVHAQAAGAIGIVVADSAAGCPALGMSGVEPSITTPIVRVTQADGVQLKSGLPLGLNATLRVDPALRAGADAEGRVLVYTPIPFALGSSVSHWDTSAEPNLLMEPALNPQLSRGVDLTQAQFADIGWYAGTAAVESPVATPAVLGACAPNPTRAGAAIRFALARAEPVEVTVHDLAGRLVRRVLASTLPAGDHVAHWDGRDASGAAVAPGVYLYRLRTPTFAGARHLAVVR
jgi:hypothetical protein